MSAKNVDDKVSPVVGSNVGGMVVSRRRFTRAGLSGSVVLGSLVSKPVLGAVPYHCTVSGQVSGNLSRAALAGECVKGSSTKFWIDGAWPAAFTKGTAPDAISCSFTADGLSRGTNFNGYTSGAGVPPLMDAYFNKPPGDGQSSFPQACSVLLTATQPPDPSTMFQVLSTPEGGKRKFLLGRVAVTSLLNAASLGMDYPVTTHTIIAMFNATFDGGKYYPVGGTAPAWNRVRVIEYLSSLYQP